LGVWGRRSALYLAIVAVPVAAAVPASATNTAPGADVGRRSVFGLAGPMVQGGHAIGRLPAGAHQLTFAGRPVGVAPDGRFIIGFGRDAPAIGLLEARGAGGQVLRETVRIGRRAFAAEEVPALRPFATTRPPSDEAAARRRVELANIRVARLASGPMTHWAEAFRWPAVGRISGTYGSQRLVNGRPINTHYGVDVAAPVGTPVVAPAGGRVKLAAADFSLEGGIVILDHGHGLMSSFLHLSRIDVKTGRHVAAGDAIGAIGNTGRSTGPHLHWAMHWGRTRIDPALFVPPMMTAAGPGSARDGLP